MSYLSVLQSLQNQPTSFDLFTQNLVNTGRDYARSLNEQRQRERQQAQERAKLIQLEGAELLRSGQTEAAQRALGQYREAMKTGYGYEPMTPMVTGTPVMRTAATPAPSVLPPVRPGELIGPPQIGVAPRMPREPGAYSGVGGIGRAPRAPRIAQQQVDTTFTPEDVAGIRAGLMLPQPEFQNVGGVLYNRETGQFVVPPTAQTPQAKMELQAARDAAALDRALQIANIRAGQAAAGREQAMALAMMRLGSQGGGGQGAMPTSRQSVAIAKRAADAFENLRGGEFPMIPGLAGLEIDPMGRGYVVSVPKVVNKTVVARLAAQQGFNVSENPDGSLLFAPTAFMAPRARRAPTQGFATTTGPTGEPVLSRKREGLPVYQKPATPKQMTPGKGQEDFISYVKGADPNLYNRVYGKNSSGVVNANDIPVLDRLRAEHARKLDEAMSRSQRALQESESLAAPANESVMQRLMRMQEEEKRQRGGR